VFQERFWQMEQVRPGSTVSANLHSAVRLTGRIERALLERSLDAVIARHEALRTIFRIKDGRPTQVVQPPTPYQLPRVDVQQLSPEARRDRTVELSTRERGWTFEMTEGPLFRALLVDWAPDEVVLLLTFHHSICDGPSIDVISRDLAALYGAGVRGVAPQLPEVPIQYVDFAHWHRRRVASRWQAQLEHWTRHLGAAQPIAVPTDQPRRPDHTGRHAFAADRYGAEETRELRALGTRQRCTPQMVVYAAFQLVLFHRSRQRDLVVGLPVDMRSDGALRHTVGYFINHLAVRVDMTPELTIAELLSRVRSVLLGAYGNSDLPLKDALGWPNLDQLLYRVRFNWEVADDVPAAAGEIQAQWETYGEGTSPFDLSLYVTEFDTDLAPRLGVKLRYRAELFEESTARAILADLRRVFRLMTESTAATIEAVSRMLERA
jgi:hypothetical protein